MDAETLRKREQDLILSLSVGDKEVKRRYNQLLQIIRSSNPLYIAGAFAIQSATHKEEDDVTTLPRVFAYLLSLMEKNIVCANLDKGYPDPLDIQTVFDNVGIIIKWAGAANIARKLHPDSAMSWVSGVQNSQDLFVSGKGYYTFRKRILLAISSRFDAAKDDSVISVEEIYAFFEESGKIINKKFQQLKERTTRFIKKARRAYSFDLGQKLWREEIGERTPAVFDITCLYKKHARVLESLSTKFSVDRSSGDEMIMPGAGATYSYYPIWNINDRYYLFNLIEFEDNLYAIYVNYLANLSQKMKERFERIRSHYVEHESAIVLNDLLKADFCYENVKYCRDGQEYETDAVLALDDTLFVVEAKSHKFRAQSLKGKERDFEKQLRESIEEADSQASRFIEAVQSADILTVTQDKEARKIEGGKYKEFRKVVVIYEDLSPHCASMEYLLRAQLLDLNDIPWVVSLHDLMAIREILDRPEHFLQYVEMRSHRNLRNDICFHDEMEILGYFLENGASFPDNREYDRHLIIGQAEGLDAFFDHGAKKPVYKFPPSISAFLKSMAESKLKGWAAFARCLVGVSKEGLNALNDFVKGVAPVEAASNEAHSHLFKSENCNVLILFDGMDDELVTYVKQDVVGVLFVFVCNSSLPLHPIELSQMD